MTNVEAMDYMHFTLPSLLASTVPCIAFLTLTVGATFTGASKPRDTMRSITHKAPYIFLKTAPYLPIMEFP